MHCLTGARAGRTEEPGHADASDPKTGASCSTRQTVIYKEQQGRDLLAKKPDQVSQPNTPAQMAVKDNFRQAAAYAKGAMQDTQSVTGL
jgi:hypothetical protein